MRTKFLATTGAALTAFMLSTAAMADVGWGAGLTWTFGGPKPSAGPALGMVFKTPVAVATESIYST